MEETKKTPQSVSNSLYKTEFIKVISSIKNIQDSIVINKKISSNFFHRLDIYKACYQSRIMDELAESSLKRPIFLFGKEFFNQLMFIYYKKYPIKNGFILDNLKNLPLFVRRNFSGIFGIVLSETIKISLDFWRFSFSSDRYNVYEFSSKLFFDFHSFMTLNENNLKEMDYSKLMEINYLSKKKKRKVIFYKHSKINIECYRV